MHLGAFLCAIILLSGMFSRFTKNGECGTRRAALGVHRAGKDACSCCPYSAGVVSHFQRSRSRPSHSTIHLAFLLFIHLHLQACYFQSRLFQRQPSGLQMTGLNALLYFLLAVWSLPGAQSLKILEPANLAVTLNGTRSPVLPQFLAKFDEVGPLNLVLESALGATNSCILFFPPVGSMFSFHFIALTDHISVPIFHQIRQSFFWPTGSLRPHF
jgi:hypothetical protein